MSADDLVSRISAVRFTPVRFRESYEMEQVDELLDRLEEAASRGHSLGPVADTAHLQTGKWREGYDIGEVDQFLADIGTAAPPVTESRTQTPYGPSFPVAPASMIEEKPGLMSRLFGRKKS